MTDSSPLDTEIRRMISIAGPIPVARYMEMCLTHPQHGYYMTQDPFGVSGDFTTAPEISQIFGELLGLWAISVWRIMGSPETVHLVELGGGRGTMMRDALRVSKVVPDFRAAVSVHLVEVSPALETMQRRALEDQGLPVFWHRDLSEVPEGAIIILANEYLDALPVHQAVKQADGWHERLVGVDAHGNFAFALAKDALPQFDRILPRKVRDAPTGSVFEWRPNLHALDIALRVRDGGAALFVDYGHVESDIGDTLQSVEAHVFANPLAEPGRADITAHVDFQAFAQAADSLGAATHGPVEQGEFLQRLGIESRAEALKRQATPEQSADITAGAARLTETARTGMGQLFKAIALADPKIGALPGFER